MNTDQISVEVPSRELDAYIFTMITGKEAYGKPTVPSWPNLGHRTIIPNYAPNYSIHDEDATHLMKQFWTADLHFYHFGDQGLWCRVKLVRGDHQTFEGSGEEFGPATDFCLLVCRAALVAYQRLDRQHYEDGPVMRAAIDRRIKN